jgi:type II secretory pathway component PulF
MAGFYLRLFFPGSKPLFQHFFDRIRWMIPGYRQFLQQRGLDDLCDFVADAANAGVPLDQALTEAGNIQRNSVFQERVEHWARGVCAGEKLDEAARRAGMPALVVGMVATIRSSEDIVQTFSFLSRHYEFAFSRLREVIRGLFIPVAVCCLGLLVGLVASSLFMSMTRVIAATDYYRGGF